MNNNDLFDSKLLEKIDNSIDAGIDKAFKEIKYKKSKKRKKIFATTAACIGILFTLGVTNTAFASKIPIVGGVFKSIENNLIFKGNYSKYASSVNEKVSNNNVTITLSDILCDGEGLYVTYIIESQVPFKHTSWGDKPLNRNQLLTEHAYNKVSFSNNKLNDSGFAGLEGKFVDEHTFIGIERYYLNSLNTEIPDTFDFYVKFNKIRSKDLTPNENDQVFTGNWAFKVPVKVDKALSKKIDINYTNNKGFSLTSMKLTPFRLAVNTVNPDNKNYTLKVFDDKNNELKLDGGNLYDNNKQIHYFASPNKDCKSLRVVIYIDILHKKETITHTDGSTETSYDKVGTETLLDKIISLE